MADNTLMQTLLKHFTKRPLNELRSVNFGKNIYLYFTKNFDPEKYAAYNEKDFDDPVKGLAITRELFRKHQEIPDNVMVDFLVEAFTKADENIIDYKMVADLVESDAYKRYGTRAGTSTFEKKQNFERWLIHDSTMSLSNIHNINPVDVYLNQDAILRVASGVGGNGTARGNVRSEVEKQIEFSAKYFKDYFENADDDVFEKLAVISENVTNDSYITQIKKVYETLYAKDEGFGIGVMGTMVNSTTKGASTRVFSNVMSTAWGMETNKLLYAFCKYHNKTAEYKNVYVPYSIDVNAEKFKQNLVQSGLDVGNEQGNTQTQQTSTTSLDNEQEETIQSVQQNLNSTTQQVNKKLYPRKSMSPFVDVVLTFGGSVVGATAISAVSKINPPLGLALGAAMSIGGGVYGAWKKVQAEKELNGGKPLTKEQYRKIGLEFAVSTLTTASAFIIPGKLGEAGKKLMSLWRVAGAVHVGTRTFFNDLERRADFKCTEAELEELHTAEKPKGIKGFVASIGRFVFGIDDNSLDRLVTDYHEKRLTKTDLAKSFFYGLGKGTALGVGGALGRLAGGKLGETINNFHAEYVKGVDAKPDNSKLSPAQADNDGNQKSPYDQYREEQQKAYEQYLHNQHAQMNDTGLHLTDENMTAIKNIGHVDLADKAMATAHVDNHQQFVNTVQHDWYTVEQEKAAVGILQQAGLSEEDAYGVLRKVGSMARFESAGEISMGGHQNTLNHLCNGLLYDSDVDNIMEAMNKIDRFGGLEGAEYLQHNTPGPKTISDYDPSAGNSGTTQQSSQSTSTTKTTSSFTDQHTPGPTSISDYDPSANVEPTDEQTIPNTPVPETSTNNNETHDDSNTPGPDSIIDYDPSVNAEFNGEQFGQDASASEVPTETTSEQGNSNTPGPNSIAEYGVSDNSTSLFDSTSPSFSDIMGSSLDKNPVYFDFSAINPDDKIEVNHSDFGINLFKPIVPSINIDPSSEK